MSPSISKRLFQLVLVTLACCMVAEAAEPPIEQLDEIAVTAMQAKIRELRQAAEKAEDAFYARYNEVNKDDDFDVDCKVKTEGLFRQHRCVGVWIERMEASDGIMFWESLTAGAGFVPLAAITAEGRKKEFAESLLRAIKSDARLRQLATDRENIETEFQKARAKLFGGDGK